MMRAFNKLDAKAKRVMELIVPYMPEDLEDEIYIMTVMNVMGIDHEMKHHPNDPHAYMHMIREVSKLTYHLDKNVEREDAALRLRDCNLISMFLSGMVLRNDTLMDQIRDILKGVGLK